MICAIGFIAIFKMAFAQIPINEATKKAEYTEVVNVSGASQSELYQRLYHWFTTFYKNPTSVIITNDEAGGKIIGKHRIDLYNTVSKQAAAKKGLEYYTIEVAVKDGKFKYSINDIFFFNTPKIYIESWLKADAAENEKDWVNQTHKALQELIENLKTTMSAPIGKKEEDNW